MDPKLVNRDVFSINEFTEFMTLKNFSKRTIKTYTQIVVQFVAWWQSQPGSIPMSDDVVRKYLLHRFDQGKDWQTVNSDYSAIQKWFKNVLFLEWRLTKVHREVFRFDWCLPTPNKSPCATPKNKHPQSFLKSKKCIGILRTNVRS